MKRLLTALLVIGFCGMANGSARADDEIRYYDRTAKKEATASGTITAETPGQVTLKPKTGAAKEIPAVDITDVVYQVSNLVKLDYRSAHISEMAAYTAGTAAARKSSLETALTRYQKILPEVKEARAKAHFEFTIAKLLARQAEEDPSRAEKATAALQKFIKNHPDSWQISHCAKLLAQLQIRQKDFDGAQQTYDELAKLPGLSRDIRQQADLMTAQVLIAAKKYGDAETKLQGLAQTVKSDDPEAIRIQVALAQCQAANGKSEQAIPKLEDIITKTGDPDLKALAYNTLGDCYLEAKQPEKALWPFLWVDVMYHQNREQHAKALYHLYKLFKERQDEAKAQQCRDRLEKDKEFSGLEYQIRLLDEDKTTAGGSK